MNRIKKIIVITSYVLLLALFFWGGYALGSIREMAIAQKDNTQRAQVMNRADTAREEYSLIIENGRLNLYRTDGVMKELLAYEDISMEIYPPDDIRELETGMEFDSLSEAQSAFENFVS